MSKRCDAPEAGGQAQTRTSCAPSANEDDPASRGGVYLGVCGRGDLQGRIIHAQVQAELPQDRRHLGDRG